MTCKENETQPMSLQVTEGLTVAVLPNLNHEFLMPTKDVAKGYGVTPETVRSHLSRNSEDFIEGKHFLKSVAICNGALKSGSSRTTMFTKRGIVRLGFFIKSQNAHLFRDWAEDLIIHQLENSKKFIGADVPPYINDILYEFDTRVRTKLINDEKWYKVRDISLLLKMHETSYLMSRLSSLSNYKKITPDFWNIAEWWCNREGVREFLNTRNNKNMIRLHDALFSPQLSLMDGRKAL